MSRIKQMSRAGWVIIGAVIALLLYPSVASAASTVYDGIIGTSGHKADVTAASQLLTAEAAPGSYFHHTAQASDTANTVVATPPSGRALIVTGLGVDFGSGGNVDQVSLWIGNATCASTLEPIATVSAAIIWNGSGTKTEGGLQQVPVSPGIAIPASDRLCGTSIAAIDLIVVSGYSVASSVVTSPH